MEKLTSLCTPLQTTFFPQLLWWSRFILTLDAKSDQFATWHRFWIGHVANPLTSSSRCHLPVSLIKCYPTWMLCALPSQSLHCFSLGLQQTAKHTAREESFQMVPGSRHHPGLSTHLLHTRAQARTKLHGTSVEQEQLYYMRPYSCDAQIYQEAVNTQPVSL